MRAWPPSPPEGGTPARRRRDREWEWVPPAPAPPRPSLVRATSHSADMPTPWLAGVCSGLSVHLGWSVRLVRVGMVLLTVFFGAGAVLYVWLLATVPVEGRGDGSTATRRLARRIARTGTDRAWRTSRNQLLIIGVVLVAVAGVMVLLTANDVVRTRDLAAGLLVLSGLALIWSQIPRLSRQRTPTVIAITLGGALALVLGFVLWTSRDDQPRALLRGALIGIVAVACLAAALLPLWMRMMTELTVAQKDQVRESERADIAARLHDSVLQTLTLIRASAEDPTRVRALALTQERELRSWLYTGHEEAAESLAEAVRETIGQVESTYGVAVDVVTVGDTVPGPAELALAAATGEAATNAVRHAEPPVSVYVEVDTGVVDAFIKDAGTGFDPDAIPEDRHGVRHSIIGRVERVGGTARIRCRPTGTEIHLQVPRTDLPDAEGAPTGPAGHDGDDAGRGVRGGEH